MTTYNFADVEVLPAASPEIKFKKIGDSGFTVEFDTDATLSVRQIAESIPGTVTTMKISIPGGMLIFSGEVVAFGMNHGHYKIILEDAIATFFGGAYIGAPVMPIQVACGLAGNLEGGESVPPRLWTGIYPIEAIADLSGFVQVDSGE